jgi:hypothetical protein
VAEVGGDGEQSDQLVAIEDLGQRRGDLGAGHVEVGVGPVESDAVEEAHAVADGVAGGPVQSLALLKEQEAVLDFAGGDPVGAAAIVPGEPGDRVQVRRHGAAGESANVHVVDHALTKRCHESSPLRCGWVRRHTGGGARRCPRHRTSRNFEYARRTSLQSSPSEPAEVLLFKQFNDYRHYPYAEMMLPRSAPAMERDASVIPIRMWAKLPRAA